MRDRAFIDASVYDVNPPLILHIESESEIFAVHKRITRTATLDGGVAMSDTGEAVGDRTITLVLLAPLIATLNEIERLMQDYDYVTIGLVSGLFIGKIRRSRSVGDRTTISFLVESRLDQ